MIIQIDRKECLATYPKFPTTDEYRNKFYYPDVFKGYTLTVTAASIHQQIKQVAIGLITIAESINIDTLIFLGDTTTALRYQDNEYKPVKDSLLFLKNNKIGKRYNGAMEIAVTELPVFLKHIFWLTRCNTAFPKVHFMDKEQRIVGDICKYGNLHLQTIDKKTDKIVSAIISTRNFSQVDERGCYNHFSTSSAIKGRKTIA